MFLLDLYTDRSILNKRWNMGWDVDGRRESVKEDVGGRRVGVHCLRGPGWTSWVRRRDFGTSAFYSWKERASSRPALADSSV